MVAYPVNHVLLRINGWFGPLNTDHLEQWGVGFRIFVGATPLTEEKKLAFLTAVKPAVQAFHVSSYSGAPEPAWLHNISAAYVGVDGKYVGGASQPTTVVSYSPPLAGTNTNTHPYSQARVFSLKTDLERGRASQGRFYYPNGVNVDSSGRWQASEVSAAATAARVHGPRDHSCGQGGARGEGVRGPHHPPAILTYSRRARVPLVLDRRIRPQSNGGGSSGPGTVQHQGET